MKAVTPKCGSCEEHSTCAAADKPRGFATLGSPCAPRATDAPPAVCIEITTVKPWNIYWGLHFSGNFTSVVPTTTHCSGGSELSSAEENSPRSAAWRQLTGPRRRLLGLAPGSPRSAGRRSRVWAAPLTAGGRRQTQERRRAGEQSRAEQNRAGGAAQERGGGGGDDSGYSVPPPLHSRSPAAAAPGTWRVPRDPRPPLRGEGRGPGPAQGTLRACAAAAAPPGALCAGGLREEGRGGKAEAVPRGACWSLALPTIKIHHRVSFESILLRMQNSN